MWAYGRTTDWTTFRHHGMIFPPHNKDCAIFSEQIGGRYFALHRPSSPNIGGNYIWLAESPDLDHWGNHRCIAQVAARHVGQCPRRRRSRSNPHARRLARDLPWRRCQSSLLPWSAAFGS